MNKASDLVWVDCWGGYAGCVVYLSTDQAAATHPETTLRACVLSCTQSWAGRAAAFSEMIITRKGCSWRSSLCRCNYVCFFADEYLKCFLHMDSAGKQKETHLFPDSFSLQTNSARAAARKTSHDVCTCDAADPCIHKVRVYNITQS